MTKEELYLKTIFCCIACDGDIATEEVEMIKELCSNDQRFRELYAERCINSWIVEINEQGSMFLQSYLREVNTVELNEKEQLLLISYAIKSIEADSCIKYSEVKFFKKIRSHLLVSDEKILAEHPDKEDFLLPDLNVSEMPALDENIQFAQISIPIRAN